jgi:polyphosphate kinase 2 (PPK2 family)
MLENLNLDRKLAREKYQELLPGLQRRLYDLEKACWDQRISSVVVFEGWEAAGKGGAIANLTERLDPRGFKLHAIQPPRTFEQQRPWLYRFWLRVPDRGEMAIFDRSWYLRVLLERIEGLAPKPDWQAAYRDILDFERMLADDGAVLIKFFFHISKKEQRKRFRKLRQDPLEAWRVDKAAQRQHRKYEQYLEAVEEMLELTESEFAPWTIVEATSRWWARKKVFDAIIAALEKRLGANAPSAEPARQAAEREADLRQARRTLEAEPAEES